MNNNIQRVAKQLGNLNDKLQVLSIGNHKRYNIKLLFFFFTFSFSIFFFFFEFSLIFILFPFLYPFNFFVRAYMYNEHELQERIRKQEAENQELRNQMKQVKRGEEEVRRREEVRGRGEGR